MLNFNNFRIEPFGSSQYFFDDIILKDKKSTLSLLEQRNLTEKFREDTERLWKEGIKVSLLNLRLPFVLQLEYTYKCPLKCKYCYSSSAPEREETMNFKDFKRIVGKISREDIFDIYVLGGEPFEFPNYLKFLLENVEGRYITISTNAVLVDKESCKWLKESKNKVSISVGIDGYTPEIHNATRGGFDEMYRALKLFNSYGIPLMATTCITKFNYKNLEDLVKFLINNNFGAVQILPVESSHLSEKTKQELDVEEDIRPYIKEIRDRWKDKIYFSLSFHIPGEESSFNDAVPYGPCTAGVTSAGINIYGDLVLCPAVPTIAEKINTTIEDAFLNLKKGIRKQRKVLEEESKISIDQGCRLFGYAQRCVYTR